MTAREVAARTALVVASTVLTFAVCEVACRVYLHGTSRLLRWQNEIERARAGDDVGQAGSRYIDDPRLGWIPRPNYASADYNVDATGYRRNGAGRAEGPAILATGDSFTDGVDVADGESWPSYLESLTGRRTLNAGVSGYGIDQMALRAERDVASAHPAVVVVSFIPDDILRTEFSRLWFRDKPYFDVEGDALVLRHVPVPRSIDRGVMPVLRRLFGWSVLVETLADRLGLPTAWSGEQVHALPAGRGEEIACRLMKRLSGLGVPVLVVAQYERAMWHGDGTFNLAERRQSEALLQCAGRAGLAPLDLFESLQQVVRTRGVSALYGAEHHNAEGNRFVAEAISRALQR